MKTEQFLSLIPFEMIKFAMLIFLFVGYVEKREQQISFDEAHLSLPVE